MKLAPRVALITALASLGVVLAASAQQAPVSPGRVAAQAIKYRQADMDLQAYSLAPVLPMLQGGRFDADVALKVASRLTVLMEILRDAFETDTSKSSLRSHARSQIWSDPLAFELRIRDMQTAVATMTTAAMWNDQSRTLKAARGIVDACRACHAQFAVGLRQ